MNACTRNRRARPTRRRGKWRRRLGEEGCSDASGASQAAIHRTSAIGAIAAARSRRACSSASASASKAATPSTSASADSARVANPSGRSGGHLALESWAARQAQSGGVAARSGARYIFPAGASVIRSQADATAWLAAGSSADVAASATTPARSAQRAAAATTAADVNGQRRASRQRERARDRRCRASESIGPAAIAAGRELHERTIGEDGTASAAAATTIPASASASSDHRVVDFNRRRIGARFAELRGRGPRAQGTATTACARVLRQTCDRRAPRSVVPARFDAARRALGLAGRTRARCSAVLLWRSVGVCAGIARAPASTAVWLGR